MIFWSQAHLLNPHSPTNSVYPKSWNERNLLRQRRLVYPYHRIAPSDLNPWNDFDAWLISVSLTCLQTPWQLCRLSHCWRRMPEASCIQMGSFESRDALVVQRIVLGPHFYFYCPRTCPQCPSVLHPPLLFSVFMLKKQDDLYMSSQIHLTSKIIITHSCFLYNSTMWTSCEIQMGVPAVLFTLVTQ